jgi:hypothetical protein
MFQCQDIIGGGNLKQILILVVGMLLLASLLTANANAMTKSELIEAVAKKSGVSKSNTTTVIDSFFDVTVDLIEEQDKLLIGFNDLSRMRLYLSYRLLNKMGFLLGAGHGESVMCIVDGNIIGKEVRFGDGILGRRLPN